MSLTQYVLTCSIKRQRRIFLVIAKKLKESPKDILIEIEV